MLKGSDKQVSWAKRIRQDRLATWKQSDPLVFKEIEANLKNELSASWWITHREKSLKDVIPHVVVGGSPERIAIAKPKVTKESSQATPEATYTSLGDTQKLVGELRSVATGEIVVDPECPF